MSIRMQTLTSKKVTRLLEFVIRGHLGWLIVWGNVFGALIGLISEACGLTPEYVPSCDIGLSSTMTTSTMTTTTP